MNKKNKTETRMLDSHKKVKNLFSAFSPTNNLQPKTSEHGFTILETIVAVLILSVSIVSMVVIMGGGAQKTIHSKDRLIAAYLAQEGVELVRNVRDTIFLDNQDIPGIAARWDFFKDELLNECFTDSCALSYNFSADSGEIPIIVSGDYNDPLNFDSDTGSYSYDAGGSETMFVRDIRIQSVGVDAARVIVTVSYREGAEPRSYTTSEILFNWF